MLRRLSPASVLRSQVLAMESQKSGTFLFVVDQTLTQPAGTEDREYVQQRQPPAPALQRATVPQVPICPQELPLFRQRTVADAQRAETAVLPQLLHAGVLSGQRQNRIAPRPNGRPR